MVRCKFKCESVQNGNVSLRPVTSGSPENESFYKWTPGGHLLLSTINEAAVEQSRVGEEYFLDISLVAVPPPPPSA